MRKGPEMDHAEMRSNQPADVARGSRMRQRVCVCVCGRRVCTTRWGFLAGNAP